MKWVDWHLFPKLGAEEKREPSHQRGCCGCDARQFCI